MAKKRVVQKQADGSAKKVIKRKVKKVSKKSGQPKMSEAEFRAARGNLVTALLDDIKSKDGSLVTSVAADSWKHLIGIPFPAFCLEYAFDITCLPLEKILVVRGKPKTKKSGFVFEVYRWASQYFRGIGNYFEHESKWNSTWASSIIGQGLPLDSLGVAECGSMDAWQKAIQNAVKKMKQMMTGTATQPGLGTGFPYVMIVDSVVGHATLETQAKFQKQGSITRSHPAEALNLNNFMKSFPQQIMGWPFLVLMVNHLKPGQDDRGLPTDNSPGGYSWRFQAGLGVRLSKIRDFSLARCQGTTLKFQVDLSSYGSDGRHFPVDVIWETEDVPDRRMGTPYRQKTTWVWHKATTELLLRTLKDDSKAKEFRKEFGLVEAPQKRAYAPALGVPKTAPVFWDKMGYIIQRNPEALARLRRLFGIKAMKPFVPRVSFEEQKAAAKMADLGNIYDGHEEAGDE
jgi:hypothetical protein